MALSVLLLRTNPVTKHRYWCSKIYADICKHLFDLSRLYILLLLIN